MPEKKRVTPLQRVKNVAKKVCEKKATRGHLKAAERAAIKHVKAAAKKAEREAIAKAKKAEREAIAKAKKTAKEAEKKIKAATKLACGTRSKRQKSPLASMAAVGGVRKKRKTVTRKKSPLKVKRRKSA